MKMIALKDFYDHFAGRDVKTGEIFSVLDSRVEAMLQIKVDGEAACTEYNETNKKVKKPFVIKRLLAIKLISVIGYGLYILFALINKDSLSSVFANSLIFFFLYNIFIILNMSYDMLKNIYRVSKNKD